MMLSVKKTVFGNIEVKTAIKIMNHPRKILAAPVISSSSLDEFDSAVVKFDLAVVFAELDAEGELAYIGEPDEKLAELPTAVVLFCQAREGEGYRDFSWARKVFQRGDFGQVTHLGLVTLKSPSESPFPDQAIRIEATPRAAKRSDKYSDQGRSLSEVTPCPITTSSRLPGAPGTHECAMSSPSRFRINIRGRVRGASHLGRVEFWRGRSPLIGHCASQGSR